MNVTYLEPVHGGQPQESTTAAALVAAAEAETRRQQRQAGFAGRFDEASVYVETAEHSDVPLVRQDGEQHWVHAYSRYDLLPGARYGQDDVWHRQITGGALRALLTQIRPDAGVIFDPGQPHQQKLPAPVSKVTRTDRSQS